MKQRTYHRFRQHTEEFHDTAVRQKRHDKTERYHDADQCITQIHHCRTGIDRCNELRTEAQNYHASEHSTQDL